LGVLSRAGRNISRRKIRALLVIIALGFSMAIMISIPAGVMATQKATENLTENLTTTITRTGESINKTLKQVDCTLDPYLAGYGTKGQMSIYRPGYVQTAQEQWMWNFLLQYMPFLPDEAKTTMANQLLGGEGLVPMQASLYSDIASINGVAAVAQILQTTQGHTVTEYVLDRKFDRLVVEYKIQGVPLISSLLDTYPILPTNITAGRNLQGGDSGVVVLSIDNTRFFGASVGNTVTMWGRPFQVIGVYEPSGFEDKLTAYMSLPDAQSLTNHVGEITSIRVFTATTDQVTGVANAITSKHPELITKTASQRLEQLQDLKKGYDADLQNAQYALSQTQNMAMKEVSVVVAATSLIVLFVMLYTVRERTKEIGTLKAMGFSNWTVLRQFLIEGTLLSVIAGVLGIAIGIFATPILSSLLLPSSSIAGASVIDMSAATVALDPQLMLLAFGASVLLGALGSLYPAWRASRTRPAEAMRYE